MKTFTTQSILLVFLFITCGICTNYWNGSLPDGCLLAISVVKNDNLKRDDVSFFKIDFDGTVTKFWDFSLNGSHTLNTLGLFAVDAKSELIYLGSRDLFLALDLKTGVVKIKIQLEPPNMQYFWNYDYVARDEAVYGLCSGNGEWDWCRIKQTGSKTAHIDFLYEMPYTSALSPISDIYYMDSEEETIWYYPFHANGLDEFGVGIKYTTGEEVFRSAANPNGTEDVCIIRDHELDRVFTFVVDPVNSTPVGIGELHPQPEQKKMLINFIAVNMKKKPISFGACDFDQITHTMIGLMSITTDRPTHLLLVDIVSATYKLIPLPAFQKWNNLKFTSFKFIPNYHT